MKKILFIKDTQISGGKDRTKVFADEVSKRIEELNLGKTISVVRVADMGLYDKGVSIKVLPDNVCYIDIQEKDIPKIVDEIVKGKFGKKANASADSKQVRIVLRHCGLIDPDSIDDYIAHDGYQGLAKMVSDYTPEKVVEEFKESGLRGRGGAGFPTWLKWKLAGDVKCDQKYVICNADEGDPGAYMDRSVLEGDPHAVLEGLMVAGFTTGATKGFFYIRAEYPLAIERVQRAIDQAYEKGLLGKGILGSSFDFDVEIRLGAGAFVCGEETALIASVEGKRGTPVPRPPYPAVKGLWGKSTTINNVETLSNISAIMFKGGKWFAGFGTEKSKGTKVFAVTGKVQNAGLVEVPMGITIGEIVFDIGGGVARGKKIKAVQTGGPSGGVIPEKYFNTPVEYESLQQLGSIMGSGGMIVMDETDCMPDISKFYLKFCVDESCGKCSPCRIGGMQMLNILEKITEGRGELEDLNRLKKISLAMRKASLCGLGQTAPNPVDSTINYFEDEYRAHIEDKKCPAGVCSKLFSYYINSESCVKCGMCVRTCPVKAISGDREHGYVIDEKKCTRCGACVEVCRPNAILKK